MRQTIMAEDLVVGDIVDVQFGDKIPADIRIIQSSGFKVYYCIVFVLMNKLNFLSLYYIKNVTNVHK